MTSTFGSAAIAASGTPYELSVSPDGLAFTLTYSDFQVEIGNGSGSPTDMAGSLEWFVLPLADHPQGDPFRLVVSGYAVTSENASASLVISVNGIIGTHTVGPGHDAEIVTPIELGTSGFDTCFRVGIGVLVEGTGVDAVAVVAISAVDGEIKP